MEELERKIIEIIATDRIDRPISSMSGKLKRKKSKLAKGVELKKKRFKGERVYARIEEDEVEKARGMKEGIELFCREYPTCGEILKGLIEEQRKLRETYLYFGMNPGCRLTRDDYVSVLVSLGFTETTAEKLYPDLIEISRKIARKRQEERSIMIYSTI